MKILTLSNLYPRPDRPTFGMFNQQLFRQFDRCEGVSLGNVCLVPEWRIWRWTKLSRWRAPVHALKATNYEPVFYFPVIGRSVGAALYALSRNRMRRHIRGTDVVFASWLYPDGVYATRLQKDTQARVWVMALGSDTFHLRNARRRKQVLKADATIAGYICVCAPVAQRLIDAGIAQERVHVVPNGVDPEQFYYVAQEVAFAALADARSAVAAAKALTRIDVLFVGNLVAEKGPDVCLEAFIACCSNGGETRQLVYIGHGPMLGALQQRAEEAGLADHVHFIACRPHDEILNWMASAECLCLSSRSEGMPNVVLEALAAGLPVAATDVGACREMLEGESAGRVVSPDDVPALAEAMEALLGMDIDREALSQRHRQYTWRHQAERILELINEK
ncbi:MAG: glycosyltransferase [Kiritimatiellae bacterium]|nr:glycosyltransferase [Kiritimatiellia bacterium]